MNIRRSALILSAVATAAIAIPVGASASPAASGSSSVKVIANCKQATVTPKTYILSCADADIYLTHVTYSSTSGDGWGNTVVDGKGTYNYNDCNPYCAAGKIHHHPVVITVYRIKKVRGQKLYTRLSANYAGLTEIFDLPTSGA